MSDKTFVPGEVARISLAVSDTTGLPADPGAVRLKVKDPAGTVTTYTYGIQDALIRDAVGKYHVDLQLDAAGAWAYRWEMDTPNGGAAEGQVIVQRSRF